ncbi:hypothetical protein [Streptomyces lydicus]|uniref:hypothetical protein n=1 Tax=Streptomyces lydicus TaxID=47763 RepID=UPI001011E008|nr:hypothetical protein [Streptomyces lydicus]MCZ1006807.1 hypothetical protein [Streptomyces lydicus]
MTLPLIRLAIGRTNGTAHWGVLPDQDETRTLCATHSPDLLPVTSTDAAHQMCQSCTRALLALTTAPHPGGEPDARPGDGTGKGAAGHRPIPGHLLGYCGKRLDTRRATSRHRCANCTRLSDSIDRFLRDAGDLQLPAGDSCHGDDDLLWMPHGRANLVTGHRRNSVTGNAYCEQRLAAPNPGAPNECAPCRRHWEEAEVVRQTYTLPVMRAEALAWRERRLSIYDDRACSLRSGDAYTLSGCAQTHHVVAVTDRSRDSHTDILVYLSGDDRVTDVRLRRDRLVTIQRPDTVEAAIPHQRIAGA